MSEQELRAAVERVVQSMASGDVDGTVTLYHEDAVVDWPQSGERVVGRNNVAAVLRNYPGGTPAPSLRAVHVAGELAVAETVVTYPDGSTWYTAEILEFRDGKIAHETAYFGQAFEPADWRAQWVESLDKERPGPNARAQ